MAETSHQEETLDAVKRLCRVLIHDINNPLSAVSGYLQLSELRLAKLQAGDVSVVDALVDFHQKTQEALNRIIELMGRLDQFSKVKPERSGQVALEALWVRLIEERSAEERDRIRLTCDEPSLAIRSIPRYVEVVALEVLDNALWATIGGGEVNVVLRSGQGDTVVVEVSDSGVGMEPDFVERVYLPCYWSREKNVFAKQGLLLGIGLAVVYQLMQHLEGKIEITSRVGEGTCVRLEFPLQLLSP